MQVRYTSEVLLGWLNVSRDSGIVSSSFEKLQKQRSFSKWSSNLKFLPGRIVNLKHYWLDLLDVPVKTR
jgi:hypothetical protein